MSVSLAAALAAGFLATSSVAAQHNSHQSHGAMTVKRGPGGAGYKAAIRNRAEEIVKAQQAEIATKK